MLNNGIKFGTDGWRSVIAEGFTYENIKRVTQATCDVLKKTSKSKQILVGFDHRFLSKNFAETAARVATANGFKVEISVQPVTSPVISFHVKSRKAAAGIMITASHNPPWFNGFKLKGPQGGSVDQNLTNQIEAQLDQSDIKWGDNTGKPVDFTPAYQKWLKKQVPALSPSKIKSPVVFDAMHGPGGKIFEQCFSSKSLVLLRSDSDPLFGGGEPRTN